jgi:hypothetical protein
MQPVKLMNKLIEAIATKQIAKDIIALMSDPRTSKIDRSKIKHQSSYKTN